MKKFFFCIGAFSLFSYLYWSRLDAGDMVDPGDLAAVIVIALCTLMFFIGALNSAPRARKEFIFCRRRRQLRRKISEKEKTRKLGTTTKSVLN